MYGMVNKAIRGLVIDNFSMETWNTIRNKAGSTDDFVAFTQYDDAITYRLVDAAVETLHMPADEVLKAFGDYWVQEIATVNYADLMNKTGTDFVSFVTNLDHMHSRIKATFPGYAPPSFRVKVIDENSLLVDYYSHREGLLPFVEGLMTSLGKHFDTTVTIDHIPDDDHPMPCKRMRINHKPAQQE